MGKAYRAFIAQHFNCCAKSWHFCSNHLTGKLEKLNEQELCFDYQDKISTYETLVVKNGCSTLANQRLAKMLNTVFGAIKNGNVPTSISELLTARNSNYNLCGDAILKLPTVNSTKYGIKSWKYQAARLWKTIPNNLRNIDSYCSFKRGLKELDLASLQSLSQFNLVFLNIYKVLYSFYNLIAVSMYYVILNTFMLILGWFLVL